MIQEARIDPGVKKLHDFYKSVRKFALTMPGNSFEGAKGKLKDIIESQIHEAGELRWDNELKDFLFKPVDGQPRTEPWRFISVINNGEDNALGLANLVGDIRKSKNSPLAEKLEEYALDMYGAVKEFMPVINNLKTEVIHDATDKYYVESKKIKNEAKDKGGESVGEAFAQIQAIRNKKTSAVLTLPAFYEVPGRDGERFTLAELLEDIRNNMTNAASTAPCHTNG